MHNEPANPLTVWVLFPSFFALYSAPSLYIELLWLINLLRLTPLLCLFIHSEIMLSLLIYLLLNSIWIYMGMWQSASEPIVWHIYQTWVSGRFCKGRNRIRFKIVLTQILFELHPACKSKPAYGAVMWPKWHVSFKKCFQKELQEGCEIW